MMNVITVNMYLKFENVSHYLQSGWRITDCTCMNKMLMRLSTKILNLYLMSPGFKSSVVKYGQIEQMYLIFEKKIFSLFTADGCKLNTLFYCSYSRPPP